MNLTKPLVLNAVLIVVLGILAYFIHTAVLGYFEVELPYALINFYLFAGISSLIICLTFISLPALVPEFYDKLGFIFLFTIFGKLLFMGLVFKDLLFQETVFTRLQRLSMLIPIFIFLIYEVLVLVKILNKNS
ncbi:DUF6168 family protein [Leeuwenhoekiella nanhaiensis]|uniref:Uncharacterized protein n=1 Tax=Leeuwenhoekiella nanhaiensis TaxID=1655491 RepID=A0A2G1VWI4_9FLAO|nr:DUF6168 family protein [Leeuwenhoekiella nanhaiensis]PHQ30779.1 hypothetical protein CJ305_00690 [Leeuwenhoekiella nanhaiensis]